MKSAGSKKDPSASRRDFLRWSAAGLISAVIPVGYAEGDTRWLEVTEQELRLPQWDADGFRFAALSDVHVNSEEECELGIQAGQIAKSLKPDVILIPGDYVNHNDPKRLGFVRKFLDSFADAKCPVFGTLGNHDYWVHKPERVIAQFKDSPVRLMRNDLAELDGVTIAGLDDAIANRHRPDLISSNKHSKSLITMLHEPDYVDELPGDVSLMVAGHSHGGQVCLPFGVALHTPTGARRYIDGYYPEAHVPLFVSRGVGTVGPRYRAFCRPQVAHLTLKGA